MDPSLEHALISQIFSFAKAYPIIRMNSHDYSNLRSVVRSIQQFNTAKFDEEGKDTTLVARINSTEIHILRDLSPGVVELANASGPIMRVELKTL